MINFGIVYMSMSSWEWAMTEMGENVINVKVFCAAMLWKLKQQTWKQQKSILHPLHIAGLSHMQNG